MFFGLITTPFIARYLSVSQYGAYALVLTILGFTSTLATFGFGASIPREISRYKEKKPEKINDLISTAISISIISSLLSIITILLLKDVLSDIFNDDNISKIIPLIIFSIVFAVLLNLFSNFTQGFGRVKENVIFNKIIRPFIYFIFVITIIFFGLKYQYIYIAYFLSMSIAFVTMVIYIYKIKLFKIRIKLGKRIAKELIIFSLPLFFQGVLIFFMTYMDTIMLGIFKNSETVGLYNAAVPLGRLLPIILVSFGFLFNPIATGLFVTNRIIYLDRIYQVITKWIFVITFPLFLLFFLFPEETITLLFGTEYSSAGSALQILSIGFMFHVFLGLNGMSLIVIGKPKLNLYGDIIALILNLILNIILIPSYGLLGAAIATTTAYIITNIFRTYLLYKYTKIQPFTRNYLKTLLTGILLISSTKLFILIINMDIYFLIIFPLLILVFYIIVVLLKSLDNEDINLFLTLEKKVGYNFRIIKKLIRIFL